MPKPCSAWPRAEAVAAQLVACDARYRCQGPASAIEPPLDPLKFKAREDRRSVDRSQDRLAFQRFDPPPDRPLVRGNERPVGPMYELGPGSRRPARCRTDPSRGRAGAGVSWKTQIAHLIKHRQAADAARRVAAQQIGGGADGRPAGDDHVVASDATHRDPPFRDVDALQLEYVEIEGECLLDDFDKVIRDGRIVLEDQRGPSPSAMTRRSNRCDAVQASMLTRLASASVSEITKVGMNARFVLRSITIHDSTPGRSRTVARTKPS